MERQKFVDPTIVNWAIILFDAILAALSLAVANTMVPSADAAAGSCMGLYLATVVCSHLIGSVWLKPLVNVPGTRFYQIMERTFNRVLLTGMLATACLFFCRQAELLRALLGTFLPVFFVVLLLTRMAEHAWFKRRFHVASDETEDMQMPNGLHDAGNRLMKRCFDLLLSLVVLLTLYPVAYLFVFIYSKIKQRGAVLSAQRLSSLNGREFTCIKFRAQGDGNILNTLPRFFCVLTGSMSIVGTRPYPAADVLSDEAEDAGEASGFIGKPGLTGWAALEGYESRKEEVELDNRYVDNWSFGQDVFIILRGLWNLLFKRNK